MIIWFRHLALRGRVVKQVQCERCGGAFHYSLERHLEQDVPLVFPGITAFARRQAEELLARYLREGVDPNPCPHCGWIQAEMTCELRRRFLGKLRRIGQYTALGFLGVAVLFGVCIGWLNAKLYKMDIDAKGIILTCLAGAGVGVFLIMLRALAARLRYAPGGFIPRNPWRTTARPSVPPVSP